MAYTKYSLTPANNNATPPDGAPEGMLPSAVNDTMRDMMAQIRDVGDGIRNGTYTMTAPVITGGSITGVALSGNTFTNPVITGGSINNTPIGASTANTGAFTTLSATGATTFSGATVVSGSLTANTFSSSGATITGGSINSTAIGGSTAAAGAFTTLSASGAFSANGGATLGDASGDALTINSSAVSIPNGLNFDSNTLVIDATNNRVGINVASPSYPLQIAGRTRSSDYGMTNNTGNYYFFDNYSGNNYMGLGTTDTLSFVIGGSERMRITSAGRLGVGTSSPGAILHSSAADANYPLGVTGTTKGFRVVTSATDTKIQGVDNTLSASYQPLVLGGSYLAFETNGTAERMRIDSSGNVGIGASSITNWGGYRTLQIGTSDSVLGHLALYNSTGRSAFVAGNTTSAAFGSGINIPVVFEVNSTERMRITSDGDLVVGDTTSFGRLCVKSPNTTAGTRIFAVKFNNGNDSFVLFESGGTYAIGVYNATTANAANVNVAADGALQRSTSSIKYKTDVQDATHGLAEVLQLRPVTYKGKNDGDTVFGGLIAEEVDAIGLKEFVQYAKDGSPDALAYGNMVSLLAKAMQEQQAMIEELKQEVALLKSK